MEFFDSVRSTATPALMQSFGIDLVTTTNTELAILQDFLKVPKHSLQYVSNILKNISSNYMCKVAQRFTKSHCVIRHKRVK